MSDINPVGYQSEPSVLLLKIRCLRKYLLHPMIRQLILLVLIAVGLPLILITGYVSLGSMTGAALYPFILLGTMLYRGRIDELSLLLAILLVGIILGNHRENLRRLREGTENKFYRKK